jgi:hypothetical protein
VWSACAGSSAQYQADLIKFLKSNGATKLAVLGSQVRTVQLMMGFGLQLVLYAR